MMTDRFSDLYSIVNFTPELNEAILIEDLHPHRHDEEELIIITAGSLIHHIDFQVETVQAPAVCYIPQGKLHKLMPGELLEGWVITYKNEFICDTELNFFSKFDTNSTIPLSNNACMTRFSTLCQLIAQESMHPENNHSTVKHLINGLISMVLSERKVYMEQQDPSRSSQKNTFQTFLRILDDNFRRPEGVGFYADKLNMSVRNLNLICKNNFDKSVSEIIETRKLIEAKQLLLNSDKTISEIGFELGYQEKSYFSRVFKQKMGVTPSEFKSKMQEIHR